MDETSSFHSHRRQSDGVDDQPEPPRRPRSLASWRSRSSCGRAATRSRSRPRSPDSHLHRIYSAGFADDYGTYVSEHDTRCFQESPLPGLTAPHALSALPGDEGDLEKAVEEVESRPYELDADEKQEDERAEAQTRPSLGRQQTNKSAGSQRDPNMVSWEGPDDPENPKNWPNKRKWAAVLVVSSFTFISPVSSSMVAPALPDMDRDLGIHNEVLSQMILSIFILAYGVGPLILGPLSEVYGRVIVLQLANGFFLVFNLVCGFAQNGSQMLAFRFLAGLGGSAPLAIGGGILADCFYPEQRGKAIGVYSLAPLIGPAIGPIAGGFVAGNTTWWASHISADRFGPVLTETRALGGGYFGLSASPTLRSKYRDFSSCKKPGPPNCWKGKLES